MPQNIAAIQVWAEGAVSPGPGQTWDDVPSSDTPDDSDEETK